MSDFFDILQETESKVKNFYSEYKHYTFKCNDKMYYVIYYILYNIHNELKAL